MSKKPTTTEKRVLLSGVSWQQFETLLMELGAERTARLTYDRGKLELMTPLEEHGRCSRLIESLILVLADELDLPVTSIGSVLLQRSDLGCVVQPDACYYLSKNTQVARQAQLDLSQVSPPDIAIEVSMTKSSINKFALYALLEIPEIWQYVTTAGEAVLKGNLMIYQLQNGQYVNCANSAAFPFLPAKQVLDFLDQSDRIGLAQALTVLRSWMKGRL